MSTFDARAREWDMNKMHSDRSEAIALDLELSLPLNKSWSVMEFGAGTGLLSFLLKDKFAKITLLDNSEEMIKVCTEKSQLQGPSHILSLCHDLSTSDMEGQFDLIYSQMALHHVADVSAMLARLSGHLCCDGFLAIADLYSEDGSFHGDDNTVHKGFDPEQLGIILSQLGFYNIEHHLCYELLRESGKSYPIFLLTAQK